MSGAQQKDITGLLRASSQGDQEALAALLPLIHDELRQRAAGQLRRERRNHTLQPTALVNELYLRLQTPSGENALDAQCRSHFFALSSRLMRQILIDHARKAQAGKRPPNTLRVPIEESLGIAKEEPLDGVDILALERALEKLAVLDPGLVTLVELKFFGGLSIQEIASEMRISTATVKRKWEVCRAFLYREIAGTQAEGRS